MGRWIRNLAVAVLVLLLACSGDRTSETVGRSSEALSTTAIRILGFEGTIGGSSGDWRALAGTATSSTTHMEGARSLSLSGNQNPSAVSAPLATLGAIATTTSVNVRLPTSLQGQGWYGQVALFLNAPSAGVNNQYMGPAPLVGPLGAFHRYDIPLPAGVVTALNTHTYTDLKVTVQLNVPSTSGAFLVDGLALTSGGTGGSGGSGGTPNGGSTGSGGSTATGGVGTGGTAIGGTTSTGGAGGGGAAGTGGIFGNGGAAASGGSAGGGAAGSSTGGGPGSSGAGGSAGAVADEVFIELASNLEPQAVVLGSYGDGGGLVINDGTKAVELPGGFANVSSARTTAGTDLGVGTEVRDLYSTPNVFVRGSHIHGNIKTSGALIPSPQQPSIIDGTVSQNASLYPIRRVAWIAPFRTNAGPVTVPAGTSQTLDPGSYAGVTLELNAHLKLSRAGVYTIDGPFTMEPGSVLEVDNADGQVEIYVRQDFIFRGAIEKAAARPNFLIGVLGTGDVPIERSFDAILVAPHGSVQLGTVANGHRTSIYAKSILARPNTIITHTPFNPVDFCEQPRCGGLCPGVTGTRSCEAGEPCNSGADCAGGLSCQNGTCGCVPNCAGKSCGDDPSDGCGGECTGFCGIGEVGCKSDAHCVPGALCLGRSPGATEFDVCIAEGCLANPQLLGCGFPGAPCGPSCATKPVCTANADCPTGYICGQNNGYRYGQSGVNVCELPDCPTRPTEIGCGDFSSECGLCDCQPQCSGKQCGDADLSDGCGGTCQALCPDRDPAGCRTNLDCQPGSVCVLFGGARVGNTSGTNVCLPSPCGEAVISSNDCGQLSSLCGLCPTPAPACPGRQCGPDPNQLGLADPNTCGTCAAAQFCTAMGLCADLASARPPIEVPTGDGDETREVPPPSAPSPPRGFGAIPGAFDVSERGSATYIVPIEVPPGRAGIEPSLSLRYASTGGEGVLGLGWGLDGLSSIRRCGLTYAQDGFSNPVTGGGFDYFCLDGQRLTAIEVNEATGATEYRTEPETFSKIVSTVDGYTGVPLSFTVYSKDGRIFVYGGIPESRSNFNKDAVPSTYSLSEMRDREGNTMRVRYTTLGGTAPLPTSIAYTGHPVTGDGDRGVTFLYEEIYPGRGGSRLPNGTSSALNQRLRGIDVSVRGVSVRSYAFGYEASPRNGQPYTAAPARLVSISECAGPVGSVSSCRVPTQFQYSNEALQPFEDPEPFSPPPTSPTNQIGSHWMPYGTPIRGGGPDQLSLVDGRITVTPDILATVSFAAVDLAMTFTPVVGPYYTAVTAIANQYGLLQTNFSNASIDYTRYNFQYSPISMTQAGGLYQSSQLPASHIIRDSWGPSQDRVFDVFPSQISRSSIINQGLISTPITINTLYYPRMWFMDANGDGIQDKIFCGTPDSNADPDAPVSLNIKFAEPGYVTGNEPYGRVPVTATDADVSVEAPPDLCAVKCAPGAPELKRNQIGLVQSGTYNCAALEPTSFVFDIDNDGASNLVIYQPGAGWEALSFDPNFNLPRWQVVSPSGDAPIDPREFYFLLADVNGDGLRDIVGLPDRNHGANPNLGVSVWANSGGMLLRQQKAGVGASAPEYPGFVVDMDHDGTEELLTPSSSSSPDGDFWRVTDFGNYIVTSYQLSSGPKYPGMIGDFDGDGNFDVLSKNPHTNEYLMHRGRGKRHNLLTSVTDGLGRRTEIDYADKDAAGHNVYGGRAARSQEYCEWPVHCLNRNPGPPPVSSSRQSHYTNAERTASKLDKEVTYSYSTASEDMAGLGWLGFDSRGIVEKDGTGQLIKETEIFYRPPLATSRATPTLPPRYAESRLLDGRPEFIREKFAATSSRLASSSGNQLTTWTELFWETAHPSQSWSNIGVLHRKRVTVSELSNRQLTMPQLFQRTEDFTVDDYGNIDSQTVTTQDYSRQLTGQILLPESLTQTRVATTFQPTPAEVQDWLISLPKTQVVEDSPRCASASGCPLDVRTRHAEFEYYEHSNRLRVVTRERGDATLELRTQLFRDALGNVFEVLSTPATGDPRSSVIDYDSNRLFPTSITNALNQTTQLQFDERFGAIAVRADPNGIDETWAYDDFGALRFQHGPEGDRSITYEAANTHSGTSAAPFSIEAAYRVVDQQVGGETTQSEYNALGQLVERRRTGLRSTALNGAWVVEELKYNGRNLLETRTRPHLADGSGEAQGATTYQYDEVGRPTRIDYTNNSYELIDYALVEELGSLYLGWSSPGAMSFTRNTDPNGHSSVTIQDRDGQVLSVIDALGKTTGYKYGAFGTVTAIVPPTADPAAPVLTSEYDAYGRVEARTDPASGGRETAAYNGFDEPITLHDALQRATNITYDALGRIDSVANAVDGITQWTYDGDGTQPNQLGRLVSTSSSTGQLTEYGYEPPELTRNRGLLTKVKRVLVAPGVTSTAPPHELTTEYHYDENSRLDSVHYPAPSSSPFSVNYEFDAAGHPIKATGAGSQVFWELTKAYQGYRIGEEQLGGGTTVTERTYNALAGEVEGIKTTSGNSIVQDLAYGYDAAGNMTAREDHGAGTYETFVYDALDRVLFSRARDGSDLHGYTYDSTKGRLRTQTGVGTYDYWSNGRDWVKTAGAEGREFDGVGNVVLRTGPSVPGQTQTIQYTSFNLPAHIDTGGGASFFATDFGYDASNVRVVKATSNRATFYAGDLYRSDEQSGQPTTYQYEVYAGGRAVAVGNSQSLANGTVSEATLSYLHDDALGSVQTMTRSDGTVDQTRGFSPFGGIDSGAPVGAQFARGFTSHEHDPELGLINMRGRMYDPVIGQFLSPDPVVQEPFGQGLNRYAYVNNSPLNYVDPSGFEWSDNPNAAQSLAIPGFFAGVVGAAYLSTRSFSGVSSAGLGSMGAVSGPGMGALGTAATWTSYATTVARDGAMVADLFAEHGDAHVSVQDRASRAAGSTSAPVERNPVGGNADGGRNIWVQEGPPSWWPGASGTSLFDEGAQAGGGCGYCEAQHEAGKRIGRAIERQYERSQLKGDVEAAKKGAYVAAHA